jgi:hypothetical protein
MDNNTPIFEAKDLTHNRAYNILLGKEEVSEEIYQAALTNIQASTFITLWRTTYDILEKSIDSIKLLNDEISLVKSFLDGSATNIEKLIIADYPKSEFLIKELNRDNHRIQYFYRKLLRGLATNISIESYPYEFLAYAYTMSLIDYCAMLETTLISSKEKESRERETADKLINKTHSIITTDEFIDKLTKENSLSEKQVIEISSRLGNKGLISISIPINHKHEKTFEQCFTGEDGPTRAAIVIGKLREANIIDGDDYWQVKKTDISALIQTLKDLTIGDTKKRCLNTTTGTVIGRAIVNRFKWPDNDIPSEECFKKDKYLADVETKYKSLINPSIFT